MKSVYLISEDNHGLLGIAANYQSAIRFLIAENWIDSGCYTNADMSIKELLGDNWKQSILEKDESWFVEMFDGSFYLTAMPIYE